MSINQNTTSALKTMGLTDYEIQAYVALASLISGTAAQISEASGVPRSRTYEILKNLQKKGFIEVVRGKPLKFNIVPPQDVFEKARGRIVEEMDQAEAELNIIYENQIPKVPAPIWLIHGVDKIVKKEIEIIGRAKDSIFIMGGSMFKDELEQLETSLNKAIRRGINTRVIAAPYCIVDDERINISQEIDGFNCEKKIFPIPFLKVIIRDKNEMLLIFCKFSGNSVISKTAIGIWNQYTEIVETIAGFYNIIWNTDLYDMDLFNKDIMNL
jgi:sugar-specific transcriptional regulator TrmB